MFIMTTRSLTYTYTLNGLLQNHLPALKLSAIITGDDLQIEANSDTRIVSATHDWSFCQDLLTSYLKFRWSSWRLAYPTKSELLDVYS